MEENKGNNALSEKELENVLGGAKASGNNIGNSTDKVTLECPACHVTGPHTVYSGGRIVCDNCGRSYSS